jgi:hypothetical protein
LSTAQIAFLDTPAPHRYISAAKSAGRTGI